MLKSGQRVYIKSDIEVKGVEIGTKATVMFLFPAEFFPVQIELDTPDDDGHCIYRVRYEDLGIIPSGAEELDSQTINFSLVAPILEEDLPL